MIFISTIIVSCSIVSDCRPFILCEIERRQPQAASRKPRNFQRRKLELTLLAAVLEFLVIFLFAASSLNIRLREFLGYLTGNTGGLVFTFYILILAIAHEILFLPLSYLKGHRLEKSYDLSTQTGSAWFRDHLKMSGIGWIIGFVAIFCVYFLIARYPDRWWWRAGLLIWGGYILLVKFAPLFLFPLFFKFTPLESEELTGRIRELSEKAGVRVKGIFQFDMSRKTRAANAALTGLGSTCRILLADNLLSQYSTDEIISVVAHELGHKKHRHLPKGIVINLFLILIFLFAGKRVMDWGMTMFAFRGAADIATLPLLLLVVSAGGMIFLPVTNVILRHFERQADRFALDATGDPDSFISMIRKLSDENLADPSPPAVIEFLFHSHPSTRRRIEMAGGGKDEG